MCLCFFKMLRTHFLLIGFLLKFLIRFIQLLLGHSIGGDTIILEKHDSEVCSTHWIGIPEQSIKNGSRTWKMHKSPDKHKTTTRECLCGPAHLPTGAGSRHGEALQCKIAEHTGTPWDRCQQGTSTELQVVGDSSIDMTKIQDNTKQENHLHRISTL